VDKKHRQLRFSLAYFFVALVGMWLFQVLIFQPLLIQAQEVPYSQFRQDVAKGYVKEVTLGEERIFFTLYDVGEPNAPEDLPADRAGYTFNTVTVPEDKTLVQDLLDAGVQFRAEPPGNGLLVTLLGWIIPVLPFALIWYFLYKRMGGGQHIMSFAKSRARELTGELTGVTFKDIGGLEEVEYELKEIIEFLKNPEHFTKLGAKLPKGVLLVGPPGTGKTLLAKATAGEAGVPFFSISGSDFVEMFVGVGAARVRDLFEQAKKKAPCIVFIDEIDTIGQARASAGALRVNDEREQTLNQLLTEMDGFEPNQGVVIMAATNRPDILDPALLRPGRFDRQIQVSLPTEAGRLQILHIHTREMPLAPDVDLERLARITPGFSGADLANLANEAALLATRRNADQVTMADFERALERIVAGLQRNVPLRDEVRRRVAYHEGGHALVAALQPDTPPVHKVSIIPTAKGALGFTLQMPEEDQYLISENELRQRIAVLLGGRAAELLIFSEPSTGAADDLQKATQIARRMVTEFGMAEALGPVRYVADAGANYLGEQLMLRPEISPQTQAQIDEAVRRLVEEAQETALGLLREHMEALHEVAETLQQNEVIHGEEIQHILEKYTHD